MEGLVEFKSHREYCKYLKERKIRFGPFYEVDPKETPISKASGNYDSPSKIMKNNLYQVSIFEATIDPDHDWPEMWHLSIKRLDRNAFHDWRDMQLIKNNIIGPDNEGVELFPMERRLVDSANQYHLFILKEKLVPFPFGFTERLVDDGEACGTKQRPWRKRERPEDATHMTDEELLEKVKTSAEHWHPSVADDKTED
jgi:hypothetical protein